MESGKKIVIVFDEGHNVDIETDSFQSFRRSISECDQLEEDLDVEDGEINEVI